MTVNRSLRRFGLLVGAILVMGFLFGLQAREGSLVTLNRLTVEQEMSRLGAAFSDTTDCGGGVGGCVAGTNPNTATLCPAGVFVRQNCNLPPWPFGGPANRVCLTVPPGIGFACTVAPVVPCQFKYSICDGAFCAWDSATVDIGSASECYN
jgi:hypothetical protein